MFFPATTSGQTGEPNQGASVAVEAVAVGLLDAALEGEDVGFCCHFYRPFWGWKIEKMNVQVSEDSDIERRMGKR